MSGCCAGAPASGAGAAAASSPRLVSWAPRWLETAGGAVPQLDTRLRGVDRLQGWLTRWALRRDRSAVTPGLYAVGTPHRDSEVLVTANYKPSVDQLRRHLAGIDAWLLVLDTHGVNVWCAAGKGTFGTDELCRRLEAAGVAQRVGHRRLILPQLAAPGVSAHEVARQSGFRVVYGPVRAADLPAFLAAGRHATAAMRRVTFGLGARLAVAPVEIVHAWPIALAAAALVLLRRLAGWPGASAPLIGAWLPFAGAILLGTVGVAALLPWLPGRALSLKGALLGVAAALPYIAVAGLDAPRTLSALLLLPAISAFLALNYTGSTTYTSLSGVQLETRRAVGPIVVAAALGVLLACLP